MRERSNSFEERKRPGVERMSDFFFSVSSGNSVSCSFLSLSLSVSLSFLLPVCSGFWLLFLHAS